jgi:hypothetical protein
VYALCEKFREASRTDPGEQFAEHCSDGDPSVVRSAKARERRRLLHVTFTYSRAARADQTRIE